MKKKYLIFTLTMLMLLTSCGNDTINDELSANDTIQTTTEIVVNNETASTTTQPKIVTDLKTDETQIQLTVNETLQLNYTILPEDTKEEYRGIEWSSTDTTIVSVDGTGLITGIGNGICTVIATSMNNPEVVLKYTVTVSGESMVSQVVQGSTIYVPTNEFTTTTVTTTTTAPILTTQPTEAIPQTEPPQNDANQTEETIPPEETSTDTETIESNETTEVQPTYINNILIVNQNHPLPSSYAPTDTTGEFGLISEVQQAFDTMYIDASNEGLSLLIYSGYISYDEQSSRYESAVSNFGQEYANHYVDQAGFSESQTGLTIFLNSANSDFDSTIEAQWIAENCHKYGFIVRYPQGKESSTGKQYRSYQIRYVGIDVATQIYSQGLSLEEYLG